MSGIETPYRGSDPWTRLGILAAIPLAVPLAFLAAFWPGGESRLGRTAGLALLVLLYGVSVTWEAPSAELARGALLFCLIAAVLWLPQLRPGRAAGALAALVVAVAIAFPLASRVDASDPVIDYLDWSVFGSNERIAFDWNHSYGELDWPQEDSEVFVAATDRPLYWKTYVLDAFDGRGWTRGDDGFGSFAAQYYVAGATVEDVERHPEWVEEFEIELSGLRSRLAVTAGSPRDIEGIDIAQLSGDGTVTAENFEVPPETRYSVTTYAPDPSSRQLRRAEGLHPIESERYTTLRFLPGESGPGEASPEFAVIPPVGVEASPNERHRFEDIGVPLDPAVEGTPYERVLRLTRRITDGARTDFEAVRRLQLFLAANYRYDQTVPESQDPLVAFLFKDRTGYCQQFAGAMALMLRMSGIPARVVSGFAPGAPQAGGTYTVNDTDAHAWVEVRYPGIGWVTVDPTPGATPARTLVSISDEESAAAASALRLGRRVPNR